jgi:hypothetical protein
MQKYTMKNMGTYYAIFSINEDGSRNVKHVGTLRYIMKLWKSGYSAVIR